MSAATGRAASSLRVVHGSPTPEELAALAAVLAVVRHPVAPSTDTAPERAAWHRAEAPASSAVSWRTGHRT
ncbi:acyl-CoA carboxylase epsilon subunit [Streptomyces fimicarius]|uniref:acyl-CoA carboxylase epsilon subunit n=1 Tax=Streptomyces griseus TaxID=1911 RepID=UPI00331BE6FE